MSWKDFFGAQRDGMRSMANAGVIGLHFVSGPIVGFLIGYGIDYLFDCAPWGKIIFFFLGIAAGYLNVWRDSRDLLEKIESSKKEAGANHTE